MNDFDKYMNNKILYQCINSDNTENQVVKEQNEEKCYTKIRYQKRKSKSGSRLYLFSCRKAAFLSYIRFLTKHNHKLHS